MHASAYACPGLIEKEEEKREKEKGEVQAGYPQRLLPRHGAHCRQSHKGGGGLELSAGFSREPL